MSRVSSFTLGEHFTNFVNELLQSGRYGNASEVIRDAPRMMESREQRIDNVRRMICEGLDSPVSKNSIDTIRKRISMYSLSSLAEDDIYQIAISRKHSI